jgi:hypothetical protein
MKRYFARLVSHASLAVPGPIRLAGPSAVVVIDNWLAQVTPEGPPRHLGLLHTVEAVAATPDAATLLSG